MAIAPISNVLGINRNYSINFGSRKLEKYSGEEYDFRSGSSSNLAKVPVIVLLAMSPLNVASDTMSSNAEENIIPAEIVEVPNREFDLQATKKSAVQLIGQKTLYENEQTCTFYKFSADRNRSNYEILTYAYEYDAGGGSSGFMYGRVQSISRQPESDGTYLATYEELDNPTVKYELRVCRFPKTFAEYILRQSNKADNNGAVKSFNRSSFVEAFGRKKIAHAPLLCDEISSMRRPNGKVEYIKRFYGG